MPRFSDCRFFRAENIYGATINRTIDMWPWKRTLGWVLLIFLSFSPFVGIPSQGFLVGPNYLNGYSATGSLPTSAIENVESNPVIDPQLLALIQGTWDADELPLTLEFTDNSSLERAKQEIQQLAPELTIRQFPLTTRICFPITNELLKQLWVELCNLPGLSGMCIERETIPLWMDASRQINLDPTVWDVQGYKGDPYSSVALIDHGFDPSQACFEGKNITWMDFNAATNWPVANDTVGHGTKVGAVAVGKGWNYTDDQGRTIMSRVTPHSFSGVEPNVTKLYYYVEFSVNVSRPGVLNLTGYWLTSTNSITMKNFSICAPNGGAVATVETPNQIDNYTVAYSVDENSLGVYTIITKFTVEKDPTSYNVSLELRIPQLIRENTYSFQGVAPNCKLVALRATTTSECISALGWIKENYRTYNITTLVMSFTLGEESSTFLQLCNELVSTGIMVVAAAGNTGGGINYAGSGYVSGAADKTICVGAVTQANRVTSYSSQGGPSFVFYSGDILANGLTIKPDVLAPGGEFPYNGSASHPLILPDANTAEDAETEKILNDTSEATGTSFSAPAVAGIAQLLIEAQGGIRNWIYTELQALALKALICMTATETNLPRINSIKNESEVSIYSPSLDRGEKDVQEGYGRINPAAAIQAVTTSFDFYNPTNSSYLWGQNDGPMNATRCWATKVFLNQSYMYNLTLFNPAAGDFDLFLYQSEPTSTGDPIIYRRSINAGTGTNETISNFPVPASGIYYLVVKAVSGEGSWTLYANRTLDLVAPSTCRLNMPDSAPYLSRVVSLTITATDGQTGIHYQELWGGSPGAGQLLAFVAGNGTITWNTSTCLDGQYLVTARVFDGNNNSLNSENALKLYVDNSPPSRARFTNLVQYGKYGGVVRIWVDAWDAISGVAWCAVIDEDAGLIALVSLTGSSPYLFMWETDESIDATYQLYITASDRVGNQIQSSSLTIFVANTDILMFGMYYFAIWIGPTIIIGYYVTRFILLYEGLTRALTFFKKVQKAAQKRDWEQFKLHLRKSGPSRQKRNN